MELCLRNYRDSKGQEWLGAVKMFGLFKKTDPICKMKEERDKGTYFENKWFCSGDCLKKYKKQTKNAKDCCH